MWKRRTRAAGLAIACGIALATCTSPQPLPTRPSGLHNSTKQFTNPALMSASDWTDKDELQRTWDRAIIRIPDGNGGTRRVAPSKLGDVKLSGKTRLPVVIYMHGCSGFWTGTHLRTRYLARNGFLVVAPASLARLKYPKSCDVTTLEAGMYRPTLRMRQADAGFAIEQVKKLPFADADNVMLMGLSQGGITAATFQPLNDSQKVRARIIEGWTCHDDWPEYRGIRASADEPVLALVGARDPWFVHDWNSGDCSAFFVNPAISKSVVYRQEPLASRHELMEFPIPRREVLDFLKRVLAGTPGSS